MAGAGDVERIEVARPDRPVQVHVDEVQPGRRPEVPEQPRLDVLGLERLSQQRVVEQEDLADGQVVRRAPVCVDAAQLLGCEGAWLRADSGNGLHASTLAPHWYRSASAGRIRDARRGSERRGQGDEVDHEEDDAEGAQGTTSVMFSQLGCVFVSRTMFSVRTRPSIVPTRIEVSAMNEDSNYGFPEEAGTSRFRLRIAEVAETTTSSLGAVRPLLQAA